MARRVTRSAAKSNPEEFTHCSLSPVGIKKKKRRKSIFNLTGQETHLAGVTKCQRIKDETVLELNEMKYDMEAQYSKLGYADSNRVPIKEFLNSLEEFIKEEISKKFNKMVITALYPPEGTDNIPSIRDIETAWSEIVPQLKEIRSSYKNLVILKDNNWQPLPEKKTKKTPKKGRGRKKRKVVEEDKENGI